MEWLGCEPTFEEMMVSVSCSASRRTAHPGRVLHPGCGSPATRFWKSTRQKVTWGERGAGPWSEESRRGLFLPRQRQRLLEWSLSLGARADARV